MISNDPLTQKAQLLAPTSPSKNSKEAPRKYFGIGVKKGVTVWNLLSVPFGFFTVMQPIHFMNA